MRILFNALGYDDGKSGISKYMINTLDHLASHYEVVLICESRDQSLFKERYSNLKNIHSFDLSLSSKIISLIVSFLIVPIYAFLSNIDVVFLPAINRRVMLFKPCKTIGVIHDLSQFHIEGKYDKFRMLYVKKIIPLFIKSYDQLITVSQSTKNDVIKYWNINDSKIDVAHLGYNKKDLNRGNNKKRKNILYVSRLEYPGKNHVNLLKAYSNLSQEIKDSHNLIFIGQDWNGCEHIYNAIKELDLEKNVEIKGFVSNKELEESYIKSELFVYPSFYEGFGIPLLEAMNYNIPIACSTTPALVEVGGDAVETFNPSCIDSIANKISSIILNEDQKKDLVLKGKDRIDQFSWSNHYAKYNL